MKVHSAENCYISCGCNRSPHCLAWGLQNLVFYGSSNSIAIYNHEKLRVIHTALSHTNEVRSVRCIATSQGTFLLSTSSDKLAVVWTDDSQLGLRPVAILKGHTGPVTVSHAIEKDGHLLVATTSTDLSVKIWTVPLSITAQNSDPIDTECIQTLKAGSGFCLDVHLCFLPGGRKNLILACAQDDFKVGLFSFENGQFIKKDSLVGHEDWITCLDSVSTENGDLFICSGSQDTFVRIWKISLCTRLPKKLTELAPDEEIQVEERIFAVEDKKYSQSLESILTCHNSWVQSVSWSCKKSPDNFGYEILSSSTDGTICVWSKSSDVDLWTPTRLGILKEDSLGILGCVWDPSGNSILAHSLHGALHIWVKVDSSWKNSYTVGGGHFGEVSDLCWEPDGKFFYSCSADQTSRIHAQLKNQSDEVWFELGRPQVHGYDVNCITSISRSVFASGADEKVIRIFKTSKQFLSCLKTLCGVELKVKGQISNVAAQQELNLSNLSVSDASESSQALVFEDVENVTVPIREEILWKATLWPEERKLYGHGFELHCITASHSGKYLASACRAKLKDHAFIIIWDTDTWREVQKLFYHDLTVTQLEFSPDDSHLLAVSRDRCLSVYKFTNDETAPFNLEFSTDKKNSVHTRVIWSCSWSIDSNFFVTGSREGRVVVWEPANEFKPIGDQLNLDQAVTSVDFWSNSFGYIVAVGCENGTITIFEWKPFGDNWTCLCSLSQSAGHHKAVRRLAFQPKECSSENVLRLASCSSDHSVKLFNIGFSQQ
ncbi:elongator complex protein 2 [Neocloeon triangulifer]|uniref:elongator complex protein 2 n=1 Tax=Neocloeon triangulifer TaxID=2078957 RepID=UPI00286EFDAD|nr:elongator complex protein 2 [Neocloeon triangulifer]